MPLMLPDPLVVIAVRDGGAKGGITIFPVPWSGPPRVTGLSAPAESQPFSRAIPKDASQIRRLGTGNFPRIEKGFYFSPRHGLAVRRRPKYHGGQQKDAQDRCCLVRIMYKTLHIPALSALNRRLSRLRPCGTILRICGYNRIILKFDRLCDYKRIIY